MAVAPCSPAEATLSLSDDEIVTRVLAGEIELFEILIRRYNQRLYRVARGLVSNRTEAEDIVQEAHVRAFRKLANFRGEARYSTWLTRIAVYEALARIKKGKRSDAAHARPEVRDKEPSPSPERLALSAELRNVLTAAVGSLPATLRLVFLLREVEGLSSRETAETLEISLTNVRVRLHRAKAQLRRHLKAKWGRELCQLHLFAGKRCDSVVASVFARIAEESQGVGESARATTGATGSTDM